jgi:hypothetical protein
MSHTWKVKLIETKKGKTGEEHSQEHTYHFLCINVIFPKEFILAGQAVNSPYYWDCMKMCENFAPNFGDKRTCCCIATTHRPTLLFSTGNFFYQKQHDCHPPPTLFVSVSPVEDKTEWLPS